MANPNQKLVDVNGASREELASIPGLSPMLAAQIIAGRPYEQLADLVKVNGIGEKSLKKLLPYLSVKQIQGMEPPPRRQKKTAEARVISPAFTLDDKKAGNVEENGSAKPFTLEIESSPGKVMPAVAAVAADEGSSPPHHEKEKPAPDVGVLDPAPLVTETETPQNTPVVQPVIDFISDMAGRVEQVVHKPSTAKQAAGHEPARQPVERRLAVIPQWPHFDNKPGFDKNEALFWGAGIGLLVFILSVLVTLGILLGVNGSLSFIPSREMISIQNKIDGLNSSLDTLEEETGSLRQRLDAFESLSGRIKDVEEETQSLRTEMNKNAEEMAGIQDQIGQLNNEVTQLKENSLVFEKFLDKLRTILDELLETPVETPE